MSSTHRRAQPPAQRLAALITVAFAAALAGCATPTAEQSFEPIRQITKDHAAATGLKIPTPTWQRNEVDAQSVRTRVTELLQAPLTMESAVEIALIHHRGLQATFEELGVTAAEVAQASRLPNPGFSFGKVRQGDEREIERGWHLNLARLIALPMTAKFERRRLESVQASVALQALGTIHRTRKAWIDAVAAEESLVYQRQILDLAQTSAELATRMRSAGNFNALQTAREQAFAADAALAVTRAEQRRAGARERLIRQLGLWGADTQFTLPPRMPELPPAPRDQPDIEQRAMQTRLDVRGAKLAAQRSADSLGLTRSVGFINVLELGLMHNSNHEPTPQRGWEVSVELPLFDFGARLDRAEAIYRQSLHRAADVAIQARSEVREAYLNYRYAWDIARHHRAALVPLRQRIADENLLRYNGMLIGVFELLADARSQVASVDAAIDASRAFWLAQVDLDMSLVGQPMVSITSGESAAPTAGPAEAAH